jgi:hypothetical protein
MTKKYLPIEKILTILKETPPRLAELTTGLAPAQLHTAPGDGEWSVNDGLARHERAHLKQIERTLNALHKC